MESLGKGIGRPLRTRDAENSGKFDCTSEPRVSAG
jgi:hypothetical protein